VSLCETLLCLLVKGFFVRGCWGIFVSLRVRVVTPGSSVGAAVTDDCEVLMRREGIRGEGQKQ